MNRAYLFSLPELLTEENRSNIEIKGLAEWSDHTPALFLLLLGRQPSSCTWQVYTDGNHPPAFLCPWADAFARLERLCALAAGHAELAALLAPIRALLHAKANRHVVLHVAELALPRHGRKYGGKEFRFFMAALAARAEALGSELDAASAAGAISASQPLLSALVAMPSARLPSELGYWDARIENGYWLDHDEPDELPEFLRAFEGDWYADKRNGVRFLPKLGAYEVRSVRRNTLPRYGIVTAYGRWLLPLGDLRPRTNEHDEQASRSWIVVGRAARPTDAERMGGADIHGLLDANGHEVLPLRYDSLDTVGDKLVRFRAAPADAYRLMRIDTGEVLPGMLDGYLNCCRGDGYIEVSRFGAEEGEPARGLIDFEGRQVTGFDFDGISPFHKRHRVAIATRRGRCGLIDAGGKLVLPMAYSRIGQHRADGPPHFHGDATLIFTAQYDEEGGRIRGSDRVGVVDKQGRVLAEPVMQPWHLQWAFDEDGVMVVHRDGMLHSLFADGSLSGPEGTHAEAIEQLRRDISERFSVRSNEARSPAELAADLDQSACRELIDILCRGVAEHRDALQKEFADLVAEAGRAGLMREATALDDDDDPEEAPLHVQPGDRPAEPFFRLLAYDLRDAGLWMHLDWKAVDEIEHAATHMPDLDALKTFRWDGEANGESMQEGFVALDDHLGRHGHRLIQYDTDGDEYIVGAVASARFERCIEIARTLGLPLSGIR